MQIKFEDIQLEVRETGDAKQWYLTVEEVAQGYAVSRSTVDMHLSRHSDELREGIEIGRITISDSTERNRQKPVIYREGVIKLGFFIRSKKAAMFRQWATNLVIAHMDQTGLSMESMFQKLETQMQAQYADFNSRMDIHNARFDEISDVCRGLRDEVDELRAMVGMIMSDDDSKTIRSLIKRVKEEQSIDGRTVLGHMRKVLNISSIYDSKSYRPVINLLQNMLGEGLQLVTIVPTVGAASTGLSL